MSTVTLTIASSGDGSPAPSDFLAIREMLARAGVPHAVDKDLVEWKNKGGAGVEHLIEVSNGPMQLGGAGAQSVWLFGGDGRLFGVVHYS